MESNCSYIFIYRHGYVFTFFDPLPKTLYEYLMTNLIAENEENIVFIKDKDLLISKSICFLSKSYFPYQFKQFCDYFYKMSLSYL